MTYFPRRCRNAAGQSLLALSLLLLASCGGTPATQEPVVTPPEEETQASGPSVDLGLPASEFRHEFNEIETALASFEWMRASTALDELPLDQLGAEDHAYRDYLLARAAYLRGDQEQALSLLRQARELSVSQGLIYRINNFELFVRSIGGDPVGAAELAAQMLSWLPDDQIAAWKRTTWRNLQRATPQELDAALARASDPDWIAWLQLATDTAGGDGGASSAMRWLNQYPNHIAANPLPGGMGAEIDAAATARRVALLLPLSGRLAPAGTAVLEGYLAAHYASQLGGGLPGDVIVLDTARYPSANQAYDAAVQRGAGIVIGPLSKDAVADLAMRLDRPVPVLALNRIEQVLPATGGALVQMSLSPEDEAWTLAEAAFGDGARSALILRPAGAWGDKVERVLRERWQQLGGTVVGGSSYTGREEHSDSVKSALALDKSEQRARQVRDMLATNIEFTPRRRGDADVVFLLCRNSTEGQSIKPLLAFHYAGGIPVYALSGIHSGQVEDRNRDLNGTRLVEMPWLLGANPELRVAIASGDTGGENYTRLHALGADAHLVQSGFARLQTGPDALYRGATGLLTMDAELRLRRELPLAIFDGGVVRPR